MRDVFQFRNFSICQSRSAMKVGTDGVLLGAWAQGGYNILDIGAGTGLISLMMAQRFPTSRVTGVEIDHDASMEAEENVNASQFSDRVKIVESALQNYEPETAFDSIVTNPPFFSHGFNTPCEARRKARQTESLNFSDILSFSKKWLSLEGVLSVVLPTEAVEEFSEEAFLRGFFLSRCYKIKTTIRKNSKRSLLAFTLERPKSFDTQVVCLQGADGKRSEWYDRLTREFYIN